MKTHQPKDFSKTPEDYLRESRMSESEQKLYLQTAVAWLVLICAAVAAVWVMLK